MQIITQRPYGTKYPRSRATGGAPGGSFECADGEWIFIAMGGDPVVQEKLRKMLDKDPMEDPRFATPELRRKNWQEWYQFWRGTFLTKTSAQWKELGKKMDVPMTIMGHFADISEDEQAWANDYLERVTFRSGNTNIMPRTPVEMDSVGLVDTKCAPGVGADSVEILRSVGYTEEEIAAMCESGAIFAGK
jgi:crotonobetainyl-CoA:carnitine CoA-transferase CaiB-like acyl-CoA transferase